jgi:hypothetical protein
VPERDACLCLNVEGSANGGRGDSDQVSGMVASSRAGRGLAQRSMESELRVLAPIEHGSVRPAAQQ